MARVVLAAAAAYAALFGTAALSRAAASPVASLEALLAWLAGAGLVFALLRRPPAPDAAVEPAPVPGLAGARQLQRLALAALAALLLALAFLNLGRWPGMRNDEKIEIQFPANLVRHGKLATRTEQGLVTELWLITTGPPVFLPVAASLALGGINAGAARFATSLYLLLGGAAMLGLGRRLGGPGAGLAALLGYLAFGEIVNTGRMALGDFAAAAFLLLGTGFWLDAIERDVPRGKLRLWLAGSALALMLLTKIAFAVTAFGFLAYAIYDRATDRLLRVRHLLVPCLCVLALNVPWELYKASQADTSILGHATHSGWGLAYTTPSLEGLVPKLKETLSRPEAPLGLAGLVYGLGLGGRRRRATALIAFTTGLPLLWWLTFQIFLDRYLIVPTLGALLLAAPLVAAAMGALAGDRARPLPALERALLVAALVLGLGLPAGRALVSLLKVAGAPRHEMVERRIGARIAELVPEAQALHVGPELPLGVLFFVDRELRSLAQDDPRLVPRSGYYLRAAPAGQEDSSWRADFELLAEEPPFEVWQRRR